VLRRGRHDVDGELVGLWHVGGEEADAALLQVGEKGEIAAQPVELRHDQGSSGDLRPMERSGQLRSVIGLATLDLDMLAEQAPAAAVEVVGDGLALRLEPQPAASLAGGGNTQLADKTTLCHLLALSEIRFDAPWVASWRLRTNCQPSCSGLVATRPQRQFSNMATSA